MWGCYAGLLYIHVRKWKCGDTVFQNTRTEAAAHRFRACRLALYNTRFNKKRVKADATGGDLRFGWAKIFLKMRVKVLGECVKIVLRRVKCVNSALERIEILRTMLCRKIAFSTKIKDHSTKHCQKWLQNAIFYVKNEPKMHMVTKKQQKLSDIPKNQATMTNF